MNVNSGLNKRNIKDDPICFYEIDEDIKGIELKNVEKLRFNKVYDILAEYEQEPSSDEDSIKKRYYKEIELKANQKKMDADIYKRKSLIMKDQANTERIFSNRTKSTDEEVKISKKGLRKALRRYVPCGIFPNEELTSMIWEVDEDMDGKVSKYEMEKMYKRCIVDETGLEPKRLFHFVRFLMFDKERNYYITEEDTLELLRVRKEGEEFNRDIADIFEEKVNINKNETKLITKEKVYFLEYLNKMNELVLKKRKIIKDKTNNYCSYLK